MRLLLAEILLSLACFALQEVPRGHGGWTLGGIAVLGASLPAMLALAARPRAPPPRASGSVLAWACAILAAAQLSFGLMRAAKLKVIDIGATTLAAVTALVHGGNPYVLPIDLLAGGIAAPAAAFHGYKYLPLMMAAYAPLSLIFGLRGIVLTNIVFQGGTAAALGALAARRGGPIAGRAAATFYLSVPFLAFQLFARGVNDLVPLLPLLLALLALERRPFWAGVLAGLSLAAKPMPGAAALLCLLPAPGSRRRYGMGVLAGLVPVLPFLLWAPGAFAANTLLFNWLRPIDDTSWLMGLPAAFVPAARAAAAAGLATLYLGVWRRPPRLEARLAYVTAAILLVFAAGPDMHHNYYLWFLPLLAPLAAWAALGERAPRTKP